jgi:hypothetical protein
MRTETLRGEESNNLGHCDHKQQKDKCTSKTTANYKTQITDNTEMGVCYVGRKRAEIFFLMVNTGKCEVWWNGLAWNLPASAFISSGVSLNAAIPRNINPISEPS